jgi:predicted nucleic acid-binding protein
MAQHFLDSSALLKRYRREAGSTWMLELSTASKRLVVARLAHLEVTAAVVRRGR